MDCALGPKKVAIVVGHLLGCRKKKNYVEIFGRKMPKTVLIMRKTHWIMWKFQQN